MPPPQPAELPSLRRVRVAILARRLPARAHDGASEYLLAVVSALAEQGAGIEVWFAEGLLDGARPLVRVQGALEGKAVVRVEGSVPIGGSRVRWRLRVSDVGLSLRKLVLARLGRATMHRQHPLRGLLRRLDLSGTYSRPPSPRELAFFGHQMRRVEPDVVIADTAFLAPVFDREPFRSVAVRAVLTHDVMFERAASLASAGVDATLSGWSRAAESAALGGANVVIAIQATDARALAELVGADRVVVLPMPIEPVPADNPSVGDRLLFVGSDGEANLTGARWFVDEVLPRIRATRPAAVLEICGSVAKRIGEAPGVLRTGWVPDLAPHYAAACLVVVPLTVGSGLKIKLTEALAHGRAVVSTGVGLAGIVDGGDPPFGLRADQAEAFADACLRLLSDPQLRADAELEALRWVRQRYAPATVVAPLVERVRSLLGR